MYYIEEQFLTFKKETAKECLINTWYNPNIKIDNISVFKVFISKGFQVHFGICMKKTNRCLILMTRKADLT